jgi:MFS family permease
MARNGWGVVGVLTTVSIFGFIDRQILSMLVGPIRRDLQISDTQMSLLLGLGFALSFTLFAIPLARLADRRSRRNVLAAGLAGWSLCTAACGLARSFGQMFLLRMGVGLGEATMNPCAYSIISDAFPEERRATALSVYSTGMSIGSGIALLAGGLVIRFASGQAIWDLPLLGAVRPWQLVLLVVGFSGLLFTLLLAAIREPDRRPGERSRRLPLSEVLAYLSRNRRTILCHNIGIAMITMASSAGAAWIPEMFRRNFHWSMPRFGASFGIIVAICGCLGVVAAGRIADRMRRRGVLDANLRVAAWIALLAIPVNAMVMLAPSGNWAMAWLAPGAALMAAPYGVAAAALHAAIPPEMRSQVTALYLLIANIVGASVGPTLTAVMTQRLFGREDSLNLSLLVIHVFALGAAAVLLRTGRKPFRETLRRLGYSEPAAVRG